jgi:hypothetical protein
LAKVVIAKLQGKTARKIGAKDASVGRKRVRQTEGEVSTLRTLDLSSKTFGNDLTYVFGRNVAKARRENKRVTGAPDSAPHKA